MRRMWGLLAVFLLAASAPAAAEELAIDVEHFPDENFRKIVSDNYDRDKNGSLSTQEIA